MHKIREIKRIGIQKQFQITHILELSLLGYHYVLLRHKIKNCIISEFILCENMVFSNSKFTFNLNNM